MRSTVSRGLRAGDRVPRRREGDHLQPRPGQALWFRYEDESRIGFFSDRMEDPTPRSCPFVPTPGEIVDKMLELAGVTARDIVYDIGCCDGRIVIAAARKYGAHGVGIDLDKAKIDESSPMPGRPAWSTSSDSSAWMHQGRLSGGDGRDALSPHGIQSTAGRPMLETASSGSRIVSHNYAIAAGSRQTRRDIGEG